MRSYVLYYFICMHVVSIWLTWVLLLTCLCMCVLGICSSEESAKAKTQKELLKTLKELKLHLPPEKRNKGSKSTTLNTLKYALRCVRQVEGEQYL